MSLPMIVLTSLDSESLYPDWLAAPIRARSAQLSYQAWCRGDAFADNFNIGTGR
jgi:hypothetical protein